MNNYLMVPDRIFNIVWIGNQDGHHCSTILNGYGFAFKSSFSGFREE
jgi:hypothetical protein